MKRTSVFALALAATAAAGILPAQAGFYLEGLQPFAGDYCGDADPALTDPLVVPPSIDWATTSPDAATLGGRPAYTARNCKSGKASGIARYPGRVHKSAPKMQTSVPQK